MNFSANILTILVFDGLGNGPEDDASEYGDANANTILNLTGNTASLIPNMMDLGILNGRGNRILNLSHAAYSTKAHHRSPGKGTTAGHWEMIGLVRRQDFRAVHSVFPDILTAVVEEAAGVRPLHCAYAPSGQQLIERLGDESIECKRPIIYSSNDAVIQIAADELTYGISRLRECGGAIAQSLQEEHGIGRVITRPFIKVEDQFVRTANRVDFHRQPPSPNLLEQLRLAGIPIRLHGKANEIFGGSLGTNQTAEYPTPNVLPSIFASEPDCRRMNFCNVGHLDTFLHEYKNYEFRAELQKYDAALQLAISKMGPLDWLIVTADHGCDNTVSATDNTRETCPLIVVYPRDYDLRIKDPFYLSDIPRLVRDAFTLNVDAACWRIVER